MAAKTKELESILVGVTTTLAREDPILRTTVKRSFRGSVTGWTEKQVSKAILKLLTTYHARGQFGRLRSALLLGTTAFGLGFVTKAERTGVMLADSAASSSFRRFLTHLIEEVELSDDAAWKFLKSRLETYIVYHQLVSATKTNEKTLIPLLRDSPRDAIKKVLALTQLRFLGHLDLQIPADIEQWLNELGPPEELASIASLLVATANEYRPLDSMDFAFPLTADVASREVRTLIEYGSALHQRYEVAKDISILGYRLEASDANNNPRVFYARPPSLDFEYAIRLGFIRSEFGRSKARLDADPGSPNRSVSVVGVAEMVATRLHHRLCELKGENTPFSRIVVKFPFLPKLYEPVLATGFYEDFMERESLSQDFLVPLSRQGESEIRLTEELDLETFLRIWRLLRFLSLVDIYAVSSFPNVDSATRFNSLFRVLKEKDLIDMLAAIGVAEESVDEFLKLVSADVHNLCHLDIQYRPFLRIATATLGDLTSPAEIVYVPALVAFANVVRNVQSANQLRLSGNAELFVEGVAQMLQPSFAKVTVNRRLKSETENTDVDIAVLEGKTLYLFECKHSVPPTGTHEMRDVWEDIEKGAQQLRTALRLLSNPDRLLDYLTGWFPGVRRVDCEGIRIMPCVLCSHRIFAGMEYQGIPVRDFSSLAKLLGDGIVGLGVMKDGDSVLRRFRVIEAEKFSAKDLNDYLGPSPKFFEMFKPFMHPVSTSVRCNGVTVGRETYVYEVDGEEWIAHMRSLGFTRLQDERKKWTGPFTARELADELASANRRSKS